MTNPNAIVPMMQIPDHLSSCYLIKEHNLRNIQERGFTMAFNNLHYLRENMKPVYHGVIDEILEKLVNGKYSNCGGNAQELSEDLKRTYHTPFIKEAERGKYSHNFVLKHRETYRQRRSEYTEQTHSIKL